MFRADTQCTRTGSDVWRRSHHEQIKLHATLDVDVFVLALAHLLGLNHLVADHRRLVFDTAKEREVLQNSTHTVHDQ